MKKYSITLAIALVGIGSLPLCGQDLSAADEGWEKAQQQGPGDWEGAEQAARVSRDLEAKQARGAERRIRLGQRQRVKDTLREKNARVAQIKAGNKKGLQDADLSGTDLTGVDLSDADLRGANLKGTLLIGANLNNVRLAGARFSRSTNVDGAQGLTLMQKCYLHRFSVLGIPWTAEEDPTQGCPLWQYEKELRKSMV